MNWSDLSMSQRSDLMQIYLKNGITSLHDMKKHYNSFAEGGFASPWEPPAGLINYRKVAGKVSDIPISQEQRDRVIEEYERLNKSDNPNQYRLVRAHDDAVRMGLEGDELANYLYHTNSAWLTKEQQEQLELYNKENIEKQANIGRNLFRNNPYIANTEVGRTWLKWADENNVDLFNNTDTYDEARNSVYNRKKQEENFVQDVQDRKDYEGIRKGATVAASFPFMLAAGAGEGAAGLFRALPQWLRKSLLENSVEYLAGYGIDKATEALTDNGEGLYRWFQEHPNIANALEITSSLGESGSGISQRVAENYIDKYGSQYVLGGQDPISRSLRTAAKVRRAANKINMVAHGVNTVYGGMAASDIDNEGFERDNTMDAVQGLIPRAISDPNASSDEIMLGIGTALNLGPDVFQAAAPEKSQGGRLNTPPYTQLLNTLLDQYTLRK